MKLTETELTIVRNRQTQLAQLQTATKQAEAAFVEALALVGEHHGVNFLDGSVQLDNDGNIMPIEKDEPEPEIETAQAKPRNRRS